jgi:outer membrane receptor protein involved in Fe transport
MILRLLLTSLPSRLLVLSGLTLLVPQLSAQAPAPAPADRDDEAVVQLSPFQVAADASRGYVTTSALSASRVAIPITELNSSVIVINEKLIEDTMAVSMRDTLNIVSGVTHGNTGTGSQEQNSLSMRGYVLSNAQRDGVTDVLMGISGGFDYSLIERIEVIKGPAGVLYGTHSPGGIINLISKRPLSKPRTKINASYGSYSSYRFDVDHSNNIGPDGRLGYRVVAAHANTDGPNGYPFEPKGGLVALNPSVSYRTKNGWEFWLWGVYLRDNMNRTMPTVHGYATTTTINPRTNAPATGRPLLSILDNSNVIKNDSKVDTDSYEAGVTKSLSFGSDFSVDFRALARKYDQSDVRDRIRGNAGVAGITADEYWDANGTRLAVDSRFLQYDVAATQVAGISRPVIRFDDRRFEREGENFAVDLNFNFKIGPTKHKLLTYYTLDDSSETDFNVVHDIRVVSVLQSIGVPIVNGVARLPIWPTRTVSITRDQARQLADLRVSNNTVTTDGTNKSYGAIERLSFWDDRAFLIGGVRQTNLDVDTTSVTATGVVTRTPTTTKNRTRTYGALVKAYKGDDGELALFYNDNETFTPVFTIDRRVNLSAGNPNPNFLQRFPDRTAATSEFGVKLDLLKSKVVATASWFDTEETNVLIAGVDTTGVIAGVVNGSFSVPSGMRTTKGWEVDVNVAPAPGWEFIASYGKVNPRLENGQLAQGVPQDTASLTGRYEFLDGKLKNASVMWMWTKWGDWSLGSRTFWVIDGGDMHTAIFGYNWKNWTVRLRVENVFDKRSPLPSDFETAIGVTRDRNYRLGISYTY